ncbi:MAG TPA: M36 family metallopeptidase, partial [Vicinamibacteria bacterium]|nr:M36 family metallopeptidase [Vicinamibacteria bacterium]
MQMGWGPDSYDVTGELVLADDGTAPTADACTSLVNGSAVSGKVVLVDRGTCTFVQKVSAAQAAGATGVIIRNVTADQTYANMAGTSGTIHIPALLVEQDLGQALGNALATGPVQVTLERSAGQYRDGDIDGSIIAHEWTHYLTNRLIGNATGIDTHMARGLGEGWSDFHSLLMMIRAEDVQVPANSGWQGLYVEAAYSDGGQYALGGDNDSFYWGIRRVPYSTDFSKDPLTFRHIAAWEPIPTQTPDGTPIPVQFGADGSWNTEIHATGEVWTTMLWECYASLLRDVPARLSFAEAQDRMKRYMVASYKLMPMSPTLLEARDAVLAAVYAEDHTDFELFFDAFARRGAGIGAVGPYRYREDNAPVVESYASGPDLAPGAIQVTELAGPCDDADGVLDDEETAVVAVDLGNVGSRDLAGATITLSSPDPRVTFPAGTSIPVAATVARGSGSRTTVDFQVSLSGAYRGEVMPVDLGFPAGYLRTDAPRRIWLRTNFDDQAAASKVERFESERFAWAFAGGQPSDFGRVELDATHHELQGLDVGHAADLRVASPALQVGTDPLVVTWRHRHGFETFEVLLSTGAVKTINGDGAVVELSQDGGVTWTDVGHLATTARGPLYNGVLSYPAELGTTANPLRNVSSAIVGTNPSFPDFDDVRLDLGTAYAGKSVELRFRIGTDESGGGAPWEIDDLAVSGIVNTPFPDLIEDQNVCGTGGPVATAGQDLRVPRGATVTLDASASAAEDPAAVLTFAWTQTGGLPVTLTGGDTPWPTFTAPEVSADSDLTFQVTVSAGGSSSSASVVVTVFPANRSPVAIIAGPATVSADEGTQVTLDGSGSTDPDPGDVLTYAWTRVSGPSVSLSGTATPVASFTTPQVSSDTPLVLRLEVSDGTLTSSALVIVNVHDVRAVAGQTSGGGCTSGGVGGPMALLALLGLARVRRPRRP